MTNLFIIFILILAGITGLGLVTGMSIAATMTVFYGIEASTVLAGWALAR